MNHPLFRITDIRERGIVGPSPHLRVFCIGFLKLKFIPLMESAGTLDGTCVNVFKLCAYFKVF